MPSSETSGRLWDRRLTLRRIVPLVGAMLTAVVLAGAASASAEPVGLFIAGAKSEEAAKQPRFEAEKYTATIKSTSLSAFEFTAQWGKLKCGEMQLNSSISSATNKLKINQIFWPVPCSFFGLPAPISANGCYFELSVLNAGPPYVGATDLVCPAGKALEFSASASGIHKCTLRILPQTGVEGVSYENTGTGSSRAITVNLNLSGMKYTQVEGTGIAKCTGGEFSNGVLTNSNSMFATK
jgi:hypothetical protein